MATKSLNRPARKRRSPSAADAYRGYSIQTTRLLFRLLQADIGDTVCLETFDDVGVEHANGSFTSEQDKGNVATNPLSDRSEKFWKTIRNWVEAAGQGLIDPGRTAFVIHTTHRAHGKLAESFSAARSIIDAKTALQSARKMLLSGRKKPSNAIKPHLDAIFAADEQVVATIITQFALDIGRGDPHLEARTAFLQQLVSEDAVDDILRWAHGWIKTRIDALLNKRESVRIAKREFHDALLNQVRTHDRVAILHSVAGRPTESQIRGELVCRDYVRQLQIINMDEEDVLEAVNDFLKASVDRTDWANEGWIDQEALDQFARDLKRAWKHCRDKTFIGFSDKPPEQQGTLLYRECLTQSVQIDHLEAPSHFTRGSWHSLSDDLTIGWHPIYRDQLRRHPADPTKTEVPDA